MVALIDAKFACSGGFGTGVVNHDQYTSMIQQYVTRGWELAALIDMPDGEMTSLTSLTSFNSTIKLIFQAAIPNPSSASEELN